MSWRRMRVGVANFSLNPPWMILAGEHAGPQARERHGRILFGNTSRRTVPAQRLRKVDPLSDNNAKANLYRDRVHHDLARNAKARTDNCAVHRQEI